MKRWLAVLVLVAAVPGGIRSPSARRPRRARRLAGSDVHLRCSEPEDLVLVPTRAGCCQRHGARQRVASRRHAREDGPQAVSRRAPQTRVPTDASPTVRARSIRSRPCCTASRSGRRRRPLYGLRHQPRRPRVDRGVRAGRRRGTPGSSPQPGSGACCCPPKLAANSVAAFTDGTLVATVLICPARRSQDAFAVPNTGIVLQWTPGDAGVPAAEGHRAGPPTTASRHRPTIASSTSRPRRRVASTRFRAPSPEQAASVRAAEGLRSRTTFAGRATTA